MTVKTAKTTTPRAATPKRAAAKRPGVREQAAQTTRDNILRAATKVFARYGYDGGSVEKISKSAKSFDRMIYYYFGSKEGLFIEVLEDMYRRMNDAELELSLDVEHPVESLTDVICFVVSYYSKNPEFITLLNTENLHRARHLKKSQQIPDMNSAVVATVGRILKKGARLGVTRPGIDPLQLYISIASLCFFYVSNIHTLTVVFSRDLKARRALDERIEHVVGMVLRAIAASPARKS